MQVYLPKTHVFCRYSGHTWQLHITVIQISDEEREVALGRAISIAQTKQIPVTSGKKRFLVAALHPAHAAGRIQ